VPGDNASTEMTKELTSYNDRIVSDPKILVGKPTVRGTRISVETVLAHLRDNLDVKDVLVAYPRLTIEDVKACLDFASERVGTARRARG
jgi:uncharacterized protein (DUF433 family)